jgi:hypothetical protein
MSLDVSVFVGRMRIIAYVFGLSLLVVGHSIAAPSVTSTRILDELRRCHDAVPKSDDKPFESPCGFKTNVSVLKGLPYAQLLEALGPPDTCYVADGDWQMPDKHSRCAKSGAPGWGFFRLCFDCMGGGPYFICRLDANNRCLSPFWRGTK